MSDTLFDTWEGDNSTLSGDLTRVLDKHQALVDGMSAEELTKFLLATCEILQSVQGNTSAFSTEMFVLFKSLKLKPSQVLQRL